MWFNYLKITVKQTELKKKKVLMQYQHDLKSTLWCSFLHNTEQICPAARNTGHQGYINTKRDNIRVISKTLPDWHFLHTRSASFGTIFVAQLIPVATQRSSRESDYAVCTVSVLSCFLSWLYNSAVHKNNY